jgi:hypothetical protein
MASAAATVLLLNLQLLLLFSLSTAQPGESPFPPFSQISLGHEGLVAFHIITFLGRNLLVPWASLRFQIYEEICAGYACSYSYRHN